MTVSHNIAVSSQDESLVTSVHHQKGSNGIEQEFFPPVLSGEQQQAIDSLLDYFARKAIVPKIKLHGDPISACVALTKQFQAIVPTHLQTEGKTILDYIIHSICDYCEQMKVFFFDLTVELRKN